MEPSNPYATGSSVSVDITMRLFWNINTFSTCNAANDVAAGNLFGDADTLDAMNGPAWSISTQIAMIMMLQTDGQLVEEHKLYRLQQVLQWC